MACPLTLNIDLVHGDTPAFAVASANATFCTCRTSVALLRRSVCETPTSFLSSSGASMLEVEGRHGSVAMVVHKGSPGCELEPQHSSAGDAAIII
jgi:hypothetical protein